jgi:hypothetical protein
MMTKPTPNANKKVEKASIKNDMRTEYRREDLGVSERGKFVTQARAALKIAVLRPEIAKAFPTSDAVNDALTALLKIAEESNRVTKRVTRKAT